MSTIILIVTVVIRIYIHIYIYDPIYTSIFFHHCTPYFSTVQSPNPRADSASTVQCGISPRLRKRTRRQVNKNADSSTLRKLAQEDSHKVWAEAEIEMEMEAKDGGTGEDQGEGDTDVREDLKGDREILKTAFIA